MAGPLSGSSSLCSPEPVPVSALSGNDPGQGDRRYTIKTLAAGQPRAYADDVSHVRVTFEWVPYKKREPGETPEFEPQTLPEARVRERLKALQCGFTDFVCPRNPTMDEHFRTRLDWLREVAPGVWEFHTTSPYTD